MSLNLRAINDFCPLRLWLTRTFEIWRAFWICDLFHLSDLARASFFRLRNSFVRINSLQGPFKIVKQLEAHCREWPCILRDLCEKMWPKINHETIEPWRNLNSQSWANVVQILISDFLCSLDRLRNKSCVILRCADLILLTNVRVDHTNGILLSSSSIPLLWALLSCPFIDSNELKGPGNTNYTHAHARSREWKHKMVAFSYFQSVKKSESSFQSRIDF